MPATKTYLTQLVAMAALGTALAPDPHALDAELDRVARRGRAAAGGADGVDAAVAALRDASYAVVSGRGLLLGTALETALKLEETCLRPVRGYSYADLRHGPISVVTAGMTAVLVAAADGPLVEPMVELAADLAERGATVVGIGGDAGVRGGVRRARRRARTCPRRWRRSARSCPAQLVVEGLARALGLDPDNPRGLAKVTTTDPRQ